MAKEINIQTKLVSKYFDPKQVLAGNLNNYKISASYD